ncbi:JNK-interacting protein 3 [Halotydeus destructor]|nr:JNK-interacting protein 3 [Halotydeus destructor]
MNSDPQVLASLNLLADSNANQAKVESSNGRATLVGQGSGVETVYELGRSPLESPTSHVVSEKVQNLASQIYNELQKIMNRCSDDEEAVKGLMPLVVAVLESLDLALIENQQLQVELELCKDDNEQLMLAFEKEKSNKKKVDQKLMEAEFQADEEKQHLHEKLETLENIVKGLELKLKTSLDHSTRLEEKETELKSEHSKLHTRYTELLRSHCDMMERVKILIGNEDAVSAASGPMSLTTSSALRAFLSRKQEIDQVLEVEQQQENNAAKLDHSSQLTPKQAWIEQDLSLEDASIIEDVEDIPRDKDKEPQSLTVTDNFFGMEKEVENLIQENYDLLQTKNALNIVKDDLIAKVDELQSELTMSKDEVQQLTAVKNRLKSRISQLEDEFKKTKEELDDCKQKLAQLKEDDEEGVPMVQRKRFTRLEMARVLMERNQYKEKLIELQEAVRWTELIRASKQTEGEKKSPIWKFFSNLFTPSTSTPTKESPTRTPPGSTVGIKYTPNQGAEKASEIQPHVSTSHVAEVAKPAT